MSIHIGVIGVGHLGQHHARIVSQLPGVVLAGIADIDKSRGSKIAQNLKTEFIEDYRALLGKIDAAIIAVPTALHYEIARTLLSCGVHCLVEKPITDTLKEAEDLVALANEKNLLLQIGHVERFNPAVIKARDFINCPRFIEVSRLGPYDPRVGHIGVIMDLMIHDIDIVLSLVRSPVVHIESFGARLLSDSEDIAKVRLRFANACVADLSASRISIEKYRRIRIFQADSYISLDYMQPSLKIYRKKTKNISSLKELEIVKPSLKAEEPLKNELKDFIECIQSGKKPKVSGEHGRDALELSIEILSSMQML